MTNEELEQFASLIKKFGEAGREAARRLQIIAEEDEQLDMYIGECVAWFDDIDCSREIK